MTGPAGCPPEVLIHRIQSQIARPIESAGRHDLRWALRCGYDARMNTRRQFLITAAMGTVSVAACQRQQQATSRAAPPTPGAPPAFGTAPGAGPEISPSTFAEAEKLVQVTMTDAERQVAAGNWRRMMAPLVERRVGPRKVALDPDVAPATRWDPRITGAGSGPSNRPVRAKSRGHGLLCRRTTPTSRSRP